MATVKLYAAARAAAGANELSINAATLEELVATLKDSHPALGRVLLQSTYLLNGTSCKELSTSLSSSDQIDIMPRFAGG